MNKETLLARAPLATCLLLIGTWIIISAIVPRDASWDVLHYHLHNGWAFWNGRLDVDLAPAEMHSYMNPYYQAFWWPIVEALPGRVVAMLLGAVQSLGLLSLFLLARQVFKSMGHDRPWLALLVAAAGFVCAANYTLLGSIRNDHIGATAFFFALWLILRGRDKGQVVWPCLWAGLIVGVSFGLKLTNGIYALALGVFIVTLGDTWIRRRDWTLATGAGGAIGTLIAGGPWFWGMWQRFDNPIYPFMDSLFNPDNAHAAFERDERYLADGALDLVVRPFTSSLDGTLINEFDFTDWRFLTAVLTCAAFLVFFALKRRTFMNRDYVLLALAISTLIMAYVWLHIWSIARYAQSVWMIGPLILAAFAIRIKPTLTDKPMGWIGVGAVVLAFIITTVPPKTRRGYWTPENTAYSWVNVPPGLDYDGALISFTGTYPGAFLAAYFPPEAKYTFVLGPEWSRGAMAKQEARIDTLLSEHDGPVYAIINFQSGFADTLDELAREKGLIGDAAECERIYTGFDGDDVFWKICPVRPTA